MSDSAQANYAKIGFFILTGLVLITGALIYLGGLGSTQNEFVAETFFSDPVSGLDVGSSVNYRGVRVGSVRRISFIGAEYGDRANTDDRQKIYVEMAFDTRLFHFDETRKPEQMMQDLIGKGLHATVTATGVTGLSRIELNFPKGTVRVEDPSWHPRHPLIPPQPSILQSASDSATQILDQLNKMDLAEGYSNLLAVAKSANTSLETFSTLLSGEQGRITEIIGNVRDASSSLRDFADQIRANPSSILRSYTPEALPETRR